MSERFIMEVEDGLLHLYKKEKVKTVSFEDALRGAAVDGWNTGILPAGTKWVGSTSGEFPNKFYCVEQPPRLMSIIFNNKGTDHYLRISTAFLQFWFVFVADTANLSRSYITTTKRPLTSPEDILYHPPLSNLYGTCKVCGGNVVVKGNTQTEVINDYLGGYSSRAGNSDLSIPWPSIIKAEDNLSSFKKWEEESKKNALIGLDPSMEYSPLMPADKFIKVEMGGNRR